MGPPDRAAGDEDSSEMAPVPAEVRSDAARGDAGKPGRVPGRVPCPSRGGGEENDKGTATARLSGRGMAILAVLLLLPPLFVAELCSAKELERTIE